MKLVPEQGGGRTFVNEIILIPSILLRD